MRQMVASIGIRAGSETIVTFYAPTIASGQRVYRMINDLWRDGDIPNECYALISERCEYHQEKEP